MEFNLPIEAGDVYHFVFLKFILAIEIRPTFPRRGFKNELISLRVVYSP